MNYNDAKIQAAAGKAVYRAYYDGQVWSAGRTVDVGETIGYYLTKEQAEIACRDFELFDFDKDHCQTAVELCGPFEFMD